MEEPRIFGQMSTAPTPASVRVFLALLLDDPLLELVVQAQQQLQRRIRSSAVRWTPRDQLHLTLKFFGNVPVEQLAAIEASLRETCRSQSVLPLELKGFGCFPDSRRPKVMWLGLGGATTDLAHFQTRLHAATQEYGDHLEERPFHPHLTLARIKNAAPAESREIAAALDASPPDRLAAWQANRLAFMESRLTPQGPIYRTLACLDLASPVSP